jgi:hypothetical protein
MLSEQRTARAVRTKAESLPSGLENTYEDVMNRISKQAQADVELALKVLSWVTYARKHLKPKELQHAVATSPTMTTLDDDDLTDVEDLLSVCAGIVIIDRESNAVRLVHYTTQGYLEKRLTDRKADIARGCLTYLGLEVFHEPRQRKDSLSLENRINEYPFVRYAAIYWSDHIRWELENELKSLCLVVFQSQESRDALYQTQCYLKDPRSAFDYVKKRSLLHMFAASGLAVLCRSLLTDMVVYTKT